MPFSNKWNEPDRGKAHWRLLVDSIVSGKQGREHGMDRSGVVARVSGSALISCRSGAPSGQRPTALEAEMPGAPIGPIRSTV